MSLDRFVELLQALITMTNPNNEDQMFYARNILKNLMELARDSEKADALAIRAMARSFCEFSDIMRFKDDFAGKPGDYAGNNAKRQRLKYMFLPHC